MIGQRNEKRSSQKGKNVEKHTLNELSVIKQESASLIGAIANKLNGNFIIGRCDGTRYRATTISTKNWRVWSMAISYQHVIIGAA